MRGWKLVVPFAFVGLVVAATAGATWTPLAKLDLRKGPSAKQAVVGDPVEPGMKLEEITKKGQWLEVRAPDGRKGWVRAKDVKAVQPESLLGTSEDEDGLDFGTEDEMEP